MYLRTQILASMLALVLISSYFSPAVQAQNDGQSKLDEATSAKLDAQSLNQLGEVIKLSEEALAAGLDEGGQRLAKQLIAASAFQRAQMLFQQLPSVVNNPAALGRLRRLTIAELEKAIENNPKLVEALIVMAKLEAIPGGDLAKAKENLNKAIQLLQDKPVDQSAAYTLRSDLQENVDDRLADLRKAIETDSTNSDAWQKLVAVQIVVGKFEEAVEDAKAMLAKDEDNRFALEAAVKALLGLQKTDEAIEMLSQRIEKDPQNGDYYRVRGSAYRLKSFADEISEEDREAINEKALADFNKAIELNSNDYEALTMRGEIYYERGEIEKADRDVNDSLRIEPNSVRGIMMRSSIASEEGRYSDAITDMETLIRQVDPTNVNWIMQLANFYQMDKRPRKAIELLDRLIQADKDNWRAMRLRGDAKLSVSEHVEAIKDYEEAIRILEQKREVSKDEEGSDLDYSGVLNNLAWVLATSPDESLRDGEKSVELGLKASEATDYKAAHILSTLAAGYAEIGDFENARKWSAKAVELGEEEDNEQLEQLKLELESYKENKPWREEQKVEENKRPILAPSETIDT